MNLTVRTMIDVDIDGLVAELMQRFDSIITRIAEKIFANREKLAEMHWYLLSLVLWISLLTLT